VKILALETSCDETSAAVTDGYSRILSNVIYSQSIHARFGGVVPELAGREHIKRVIPIINQALDEAGVTLGDIDGFAATYGPGLVGALLVGLSTAKALAYATDKPFYAVNHLEGHISANLLDYPELDDNFLTLLVSGGHTMLIEVRGLGNYHVLGKTLDDAAGEAFDKVAKLLGLGYPGGAALEKLASSGDKNYFHFPRALPDPQRLDFSFSGLKTAVALHIQGVGDSITEKQKADIAASFQEAAVDALCEKSRLALIKTGLKSMAVSGGVAANSRLRQKLDVVCEKLEVKLHYPAPELCTDNAAMIAAAAAVFMTRGITSPFSINAIPYLKLT